MKPSNNPPLLSLIAALLIVAVSIGCGDDSAEPTPDEPSDQLEPAEAHQWCAAAGTSSDGELTALQCAGPHQVSGFESSDGETVWQPGAFHIIAD